jgi:enterochelin esterase-like enzyme
MSVKKHALLLLVSLAVACSSDPQAPTPSNLGPSGGGGQTSTTAGSSGTAASGASVVPTGGTGAGVGGTSGSAGSAGAFADMGMAGLAGTAGTGGAVSSAGGSQGMQTDPGTEGDGTFAQPPPYNVPPESLGPINNAPKGAVTGPFVHTQTGTYMGWATWKFTYYVYVPSQYKAGHPAALMIFNDGYLYAGITSITDCKFNAPQVFDNLIAEGSMPVTLAVFIFPGSTDGHQVGGGDANRGTQYDTPNDQYGKFLREEFLPTEITNKWDIVSDPDGWAMAGHSSGGIASIIAGWYHPDRWHKMLTASPSFPNKGGKFPDEFMTAAAKPLRIYHLSGTQDLGGFKAANDKAAMILQQLGYHERYRPGEDMHYPPKAAMADFADALRWLWRGYKAGL